MNLISIILPTYNTAKYLLKCINSIFNQSYRNIELICIDDGSDDDSMDLLNKYAEEDKRISILIQDHKGGGAARNLGLQHASGDYVVFLDSDDFFEPIMLEHALNKMLKADADICVFGVKNYNDTTGESSIASYGLRTGYLPQKEVFSWRDIPDFIFNVFQNWPWNKMFRRDFLLKNELHFQEIYRTNDLYFTTTALICAERITVLPEYLVNYRIRQKFSCQSTNYLYPTDFYLAFKELKSYLIGKGLYEDLKVSYLNHAVDGCMANLESLEFGDSHKTLFEKLNEFIFSDLSLHELTEECVHPFNRDRYELFKLASREGYSAFLQRRAQLYKDRSVDLNDCIVSAKRCFNEELDRKNEQYKLELSQKDKLINDKDILLNNKDQEISQYIKQMQLLKESREYQLGEKILSFPKKIKGNWK